jgi:hypothetical protein
VKTGYVYIVALNGRLGRVLRLGTSLRSPAERVRRLVAAQGRRRGARLVGYEFVEDMIAARGQLRAALRAERVGGHARTFRCSAGRARAALKAAAGRQATIRKARFHPETGLLVDPDIEMAGPVVAFSEKLALMLEREAGGDFNKLTVFLHPYMVGTIATMFREKQAETKIPDEYLPEILRDIAWRLWKCRLKPRVFLRMAQRTKREQCYLDLARFTLQHRARGTTAQAPGRSAGFASDSQLVGFMRAPAQHLGQTMRGYADALTRAPIVKARSLVFRLIQILLLIGLAFAVDAVITGPEPGRWLSALLMVFLAGACALAFNLYEKPDPTRGLGILTRSELEAELKSLEGRGIDLA